MTIIYRKPCLGLCDLQQFLVYTPRCSRAVQNKSNPHEDIPLTLPRRAFWGWKSAHFSSVSASGVSEREIIIHHVVCNAWENSMLLARKKSTNANTPARSHSTVKTKTGCLLSDLKTSHLPFLPGLLIGFYHHFCSVFVVVVITMLSFWKEQKIKRRLD